MRVVLRCPLHLSVIVVLLDLLLALAVYRCLAQQSRLQHVVFLS